MIKRAILMLQDGSIYEGESFGADCDAVGEVVFNTSMAGYQEMLTDPSYAGQIVIPTYPLIGNYGINEIDAESSRIQVRGFVVRENCVEPSHYLSRQPIGDYLAGAGVPGIVGLDTRAITRKLRDCGVMMGVLTSTRTPQEAAEILANAPGYDTIDLARGVSTGEPYELNPEDGESRRNIVVVDYGCKYNVLRILRSLGCNIRVVPCTTSAKDILAYKPDGVLLSPGPGNPELLDYAVYAIRGLIGFVPIMGICMGNHLVARAFGGRNFKLKFGHRGGNQPVKDLATGHIYITAQNHGYIVDPDGIGDGLEVSHVNLNDDTVEGLRHKDLPIFTIQYHSEASSGPLDALYLFNQFMQMVDKEKK
ncbi:MAG: glutamine-hydrolyzing carbamoyl-phosphate synthase small subunit [Dehalococcoidia bacterium]|nr:glutamine-hydrolyzing carbamoyl-phosphate synthase small subunit [Dehalococcoidia bacterium]